MAVLDEFIHQRYAIHRLLSKPAVHHTCSVMRLDRADMVTIHWFRAYRPTRLSVDRRSMTIAVLFLLAGDVVYNPSPQASQRSADHLIASLQVGSFNRRSVVNKAAQIHDLIADRKLDILFLTETWLTPDMPRAIADNVAPQHYAVLHVQRPVVDGGPKRGGGVAVVFRQSVVVCRHPVFSKCRPKTSELQMVRVGTSPLMHTVANIYRPQ